MPLHVSSTCAHHQEVKITLHSLWYHHTYRCDTRGCVMQFWLPDDEYMCSKHVEAGNKLIVKQILCIKLVKYWNKYTEMHGQQNVRIKKQVIFCPHRANILNVTLCRSAWGLMFRNLICFWTDFFMLFPKIQPISPIIPFFWDNWSKL